MKIYHSINEFQPKKKTVVTIGTFDGVHLGHKKVLQKLITACSTNLESIVLTFYPHPRMVLQQDTSIQFLTTIDEKKEVLKKEGIEHLIIHPFSVAFSRLEAHDFVKNILVEKLNIKKIIIGYDHRFGKNRTASIKDLIAYGKKYNFEVQQISAEENNEITISSTKIRTALHQGNIPLANSFLGRLYTISGTVVSGKKIGRTIGFPTANIQLKNNYKLIPKTGVYVVSTVLKNKVVYGMMNIGTNPTFSEGKTSIEVHFFNFSADLYGQNITISFLKKIRNEIKFENKNQLQEQLKKDQQISIDFIHQLKTKTTL